MTHSLRNCLKLYGTNFQLSGKNLKHKKLRSIWFHLYDSRKKTMVAWSQWPREGTDYKGEQGNILDNGNVLHFHGGGGGGGSMTVFNCDWNSTHFPTLKMGKFYYMKLHLNKGGKDVAFVVKQSSTGSPAKGLLKETSKAHNQEAKILLYFFYRVRVRWDITVWASRDPGAPKP